MRFSSCSLAYSLVLHTTIMSGEDSFRYDLNVKTIFVVILHDNRVLKFLMGLGKINTKSEI